MREGAARAQYRRQPGHAAPSRYRRAVHARAGAVQRRARSAAHRRPHRADARQHAARAAHQRRQAGHRHLPHRQRGRRPLHRDQALPDPHQPGSAGRARRPALDRDHLAHHQPGARRRYHRAHPARHQGQEDRPQPDVLRGGHAGDRRNACAPGGQPAAGLVGVSQWRSQERSGADGGEGQLPRTRAQVRAHPSAARGGADRGKHRDQLAAPGRDQRAEAAEFAVLRDGLSGAGAGGGAESQPDEGRRGAGGVGDGAGGAALSSGLPIPACLLPSPACGSGAGGEGRRVKG
ncbi:hypothetical protein CBM2587_A20237 [Cupriavidus taiwanensis]|uniref:Uncharacterized protein n=1 Tax=Cupriavidus taiwanensis TaxID=164546 RepID=A0A375BQ71_9BURK|nr:hypothetical protein CBM2587_A20237 [Cupriavidus taiwanensis]